MLINTDTTVPVQTLCQSITEDVITDLSLADCCEIIDTVDTVDAGTISDYVHREHFEDSLDESAQSQFPETGKQYRQSPSLETAIRYGAGVALVEVTLDDLESKGVDVQSTLQL